MLILHFETLVQADTRSLVIITLVLNYCRPLASIALWYTAASMLNCHHYLEKNQHKALHTIYE